MKKTYTKPQIEVEELKLDAAVAAGSCNNTRDEMEYYISIGLFDAAHNCAWGTHTPGFNGDDFCYNSATVNPFWS